MPNELQQSTISHALTVNERIKTQKHLIQIKQNTKSKTLENLDHQIMNSKTLTIIYIIIDDKKAVDNTKI